MQVIHFVSKIPYTPGTANETEVIEKIEGRDVRFKIKHSKAIFKGETLPTSTLLEIDGGQQYDEHMKSFSEGNQGFGKHLSRDYGEVVNKIAEDFCERNNLRIAIHYNSFPKFSALVTPKDKPESKVDRDQRLKARELLRYGRDEKLKAQQSA